MTFSGPNGWLLFVFTTVNLAESVQLVGLIVAAWGVVVAQRALSTWKHQLRGETAYRSALGIISAAETFRAELLQSRNPGYYADAALEAAERDPRYAKATQDEKKRLEGLAWRWEHLSNAQSTLPTLDSAVHVLDAHGLCGGRACLDGMVAVYRDLRTAHGRLMRLDMGEECARKLALELETIVMGWEGDTVDLAIQQAADKMRDFAGSIIRTNRPR